MFLSSLGEELYTKEENDKTGCNFNFGHECKIETKFKQHYKETKRKLQILLKIKQSVLVTENDVGGSVGRCLK